MKRKTKAIQATTMENQPGDHPDVLESMALIVEYETACVVSNHMAAAWDFGDIIGADGVFE